MILIAKRLALSLVAAGAVTVLVGGASFALFSSSAQSQNNTFAAGTVKLKEGTSTVCTVENIAPGDGTFTSSQLGTTADHEPCTYDLVYSGSLSAWVYVNVSVTSSSGSDANAAGIGTEPLYDGTSAGLDVIIKDYRSNRIHLGSGTLTPATATAPASYTSSDNHQLLGKFTATNLDNTDRITTNWALPHDAGNGYQGGTASITITAKAVQARNNTNGSGSGPIDAASGTTF